MTLDQLRQQWDEAYAILKRERAMRERVFANDAHARQRKLAEVDKLIGILRQWKDELKEHAEPGYEQPALLDVPRKDAYQ